MTDFTVSLDVQNTTSQPQGYTQCKNSQGQLLTNYYFQFTGGDGNNNGTLKFDSAGTATVTITTPNYVITGIAFSGDSAGDLSSARVSDTSWTITDTDADKESGEYTVIVTNTNVNPSVTGIYCDPRWTNDVH